MSVNRKSILEMAENMAHAKDLSQEIVIGAIERALASITERDFAEPVSIRVAMDRVTGDTETFRYWTVVDPEQEDPEVFEWQASRHMTLAQAQAIDAALQVGDVVEEQIEKEHYGRIGAYQARQIIHRIVREAEQEKVAQHYRSHIGEMVTGQVKRVTRDMLLIDLVDEAEAVLPRTHLIPRESVRNGDRIRAYLFAVHDDPRKGPQVMLSRKHPGMLVELFKIEVPEIGEEVIEIKAAARDAGSRAKIAVKTNDGRIDPIGACVGMRGARVQAVSSELNGERIDIILWDDSPTQLVINAMAPAEVLGLTVDEDAHSMDVIVAEEQLSLAIGRNGQNVRLASELTGWQLNLMTEAEAESKMAEEAETHGTQLQHALDIDEDITALLLQAGFKNTEDVAYASLEDMLTIEAFDEEIVEELQQRAKQALLTDAMASPISLSEAEPEEDLLNLEGMPRMLAYALASQGVKSREDLAEQSLDDLRDVPGFEEAQMAELIMSARSHWFTEEAS